MEKEDRTMLAKELHKCLDNMKLKGKLLNKPQKLKVVLTAYAELRKATKKE